MKRLVYAILLAAGMVRTALAAPAVEANLSSQFLIRGEIAYLEIVVRGNDQPDRAPVIPEIRSLKIRPLTLGQPQARLSMSGDRTRRFDQFFRYVVSCYDKGRYTIPSVELSFGSEKVHTQPLELEILDENELEWRDVKVGAESVKYAAFFRATRGSPYVGEKIPVELKVYFPDDQQVQDWGIPDFDREGVSAWRFQPQPSVLKAPMPTQNFSSVSYPSTMSANREGKVRIGPATLRLQTFQYDAYGRAMDLSADLKIPALELDAKSLPPGAPENFENAIGNFRLDVSASDTEVREGDPVSVSMVVSGSGNLDTLHPPKPLDPDGWKLYPASALERGDERREMTGVTAFRQFMSPLRIQPSIPAFTLVFFNPATEKYETLISNPIPLTVRPSTAPIPGQATPPKAMPMPVEEMTDILGVIRTPGGLLPQGLGLPHWSWQLVPALIALLILGRLVAARFSSRPGKDPDAVLRAKELRELERAPDNAAAFYRAAGHFTERWLGSHQAPELGEVLKRRDEVSFRLEADSAKLDREERSRVLRTLKKFALPLIVMALVFAPSSLRADQPEAQKAFDEFRFQDAAKLWLEAGPYDRLSADTLFNIGTASYRMGAPGDAALYFRRALERDPSHAEARQNLRFIERKFGSITIQRPEYQYLLGRVPLTLWKDMVWAGAWMIGLGLLVFASGLKSGAVRLMAVLGLAFGPILAALAAGAWYSYPDDARFAPSRDQMVVVADQAAVRTDASRNAPKVIDAPAGSLCRLLDTSGEWYYVAFTNESRGWVPRGDLESLLPRTTPEAPRLRARAGSQDNNA